MTPEQSQILQAFKELSTQERSQVIVEARTVSRKVYAVPKPNDSCGIVVGDTVMIVSGGIAEKYKNRLWRVFKVGGKNHLFLNGPSDCPVLWPLTVDCKKVEDEEVQ